jgi:hypothetical protein
MFMTLPFVAFEESAVRVCVGRGRGEEDAVFFYYFIDRFPVILL